MPKGFPVLISLSSFLAAHRKSAQPCLSKHYILKGYASSLEMRHRGHEVPMNLSFLFLGT